MPSTDIIPKSLPEKIIGTSSSVEILSRNGKKYSLSDVDGVFIILISLAAL